MDYKDTLNLPKTDFPMKAGLPALEPKILKKWSELDLYHRILERGQGRPVWVLHDGPPYANGRIHVGTALNKVLKDIIVKSKTMLGFHSPYVPGWDCHGLPIEHQVDKLLGPKKNQMSKADVRRQCREYAQKFIDIQSQDFQRLGILGEWADPYLTMNYEFEAIISRELGKMILDGRLYHSQKPVLWCGSCQTALAEAEVDYENHLSDSIFVAFKLISDPAPLMAELSGQEVELVIWTTTPWTIPANMGVAYNPAFTYGAYRFGKRVLVVARSLAPSLWPRFALGQPEDLGNLNTEAMSGLVCRHPLYERESKIIPAQYVTDDQGTGLVHTAPGHGREDFETGQAFNLATFSPLDDQARFTDEVPELAGVKVLEANPKVIELLKEKGALLGSEQLSHQYPHCWRCKKPVVFRSTPQWFVSMAKGDLRQEALKHIDQVDWIPKWGRERIYGMIENRPDWCVSRQRSWGVPITLFFCNSCGKWHYSEAIGEKLFSLIKEKGADLWFELPEKELLPPGEKCPHCGSEEFTKETDILDVWFDSGCSFTACCELRDYLPDRPNMYLEGSDQHRGWFHSSLLVSVANRGRAPYLEVLTHGYVVDGDGKKMSKHLGNTVAPDDIINKYGADILRLWVSAENYQDDIRISNQILDMLAKAYFNFRNTARFILGNLYDFDPKVDALGPEKMDKLDKYVLHQLNVLIDKVKTAYANYEFFAIYQTVNKFVVFLSSFYHDVIKDRLYTFKAKSEERRATQTVMREVLSALTRLMAPILSFTTEEIWSRLEPDQSVFLTDFPDSDPSLIKPEEAAEFEKFLDLRTVIYKALEEARQTKTIGGSLEADLEIIASGPDYQTLSAYDNLAELFIVSQVSLRKGADDEPMKVLVKASLNGKCPRCWIRHPEVKDDGVCPKCQKALA
ncbi:MAG: isoleucine--tRNA ligase [Deltaproteobacteria bacterium]|jgi:isoleucyl-tRNA synthetase|nr:isoleucine--tRNA ligase [Deltaproteobacteria bacterium]